MKLNELFNNPGARKDRKRVGRGIGSGKGKTCGRGVKGQKSRSGVAIKGFEGGQTSIIKRLPKRGFSCISSKVYQILSLDDIEILTTQTELNTPEIITKDFLLNVGLVRNLSIPVKLLGGQGKISSPVSIKLDAYSKSAKKSIEQAGGKVL